jgi:hypothetical protein
MALQVSHFRLRDQLTTCALAIVTILCMTSTIFFAFNSSLENPPVPSLVAKSPERTILILNVMSQVTLLALAELTIFAMDSLRWAMAITPDGISALTFLVLSKATTFLGALVLSFHSTAVSGAGPRIWGAQRFERFKLMLM